MPVPKTLPGLSRWKGITTIGVAMLYCVRDGKETTEVRYYISSLAMRVKPLRTPCGLTGASRTRAIGAST